MAVKTTYYYKMLDEYYVIAVGTLKMAKKPSDTATRKTISKTEYDTIIMLTKNKPLPSDDEHMIRIRDNMDGTYDYVEVEKPIEEYEE